MARLIAFYFRIYLDMLNRIYVNNFRCFENFELKLIDCHAALLIGKNGSGKSTVMSVLEIFQKIGRGTNRVKEIVDVKDASYYRTSIPIRFEIEVEIDDRIYEYHLAFERSENFSEYRVLEEALKVDGEALYSRELAQVTLTRDEREVQFLVDWHLIALPIIQEQSSSDPLRIWKDWLSRIILLSPVPHLMLSESSGETLYPNLYAENISNWLTGLLSRYPASYSVFEQYLRQVIPDLREFRYEPTGKYSKELKVTFEGRSTFELSFEDLSSGEKCFFVGAAVLAANRAYRSLFCFWDEPDNHLSLSEVGHFIVSLRKSFQQSESQILVTSHNPEAIQRFSRENIFVLDRKSHLEPTLVRLAEELNLSEDIITSLVCGDIEL